jgi:hypothetical protein
VHQSVLKVKVIVMHGENMDKVWAFLDLSDTKDESSSETSATVYQSARRNIPDDLNLHQQP